MRLALPFVAFVVTGLVRGQCATVWLPPAHGLPGTDGTVRTIVSWDPDGPGPTTAKVVVGGDFATAGNLEA